jgi:hypothetical protein
MKKWRKSAKAAARQLEAWRQPTISNNENRSPKYVEIGEAASAKAGEMKRNVEEKIRRK